MNHKERLTEFLSRANNAASEYDCFFSEPRWSEDETGIYAVVSFHQAEGREDNPDPGPKLEWPKLRVIDDITLLTMTLRGAVMVEWGEERPTPSICSNPHDLMAIFYA